MFLSLCSDDDILHLWTIDGALQLSATLWVIKLRVELLQLPFTVAITTHLLGKLLRNRCFCKKLTENYRLILTLHYEHKRSYTNETFAYVGKDMSKLALSDLSMTGKEKKSLPKSQSKKFEDQYFAESRKIPLIFSCYRSVPSPGFFSGAPGPIRGGFGRGVPSRRWFF